jgi:hypothetical protein
MNDSFRFSGAVHIPPVSTAVNLWVALGVGLLVPLAIVVAVFSGVQLPVWLKPNTWQATETIVAITLLCVVSLAIGYVGRLATQRRVRKHIEKWCSEASRSSLERAGAEMYASIWKWKRGRTKGVNAFLAAVPPDRCRTIAVGDLQVRPTDDGLLYEEADALEGRASAIPRAMLLLLPLPLALQLLNVLMSNGINPMYWNNNAWYRLIPSAIIACTLALVYGLVRAPGKSAIVSPRRVVHTSMGRAREFTPEDSVLYIANWSSLVTVAFYRNDGAAAAFSYASPKAVGLSQLVNRWCMLEPGASTAPVPPPIVFDTRSLQP